MGPRVDSENKNKQAKKVRAQFKQFLAQLRIRHFAPKEILRQADRTRGGVRKSIPPEELWDNIVPTLWIADIGRRALGKPVTITSAYRSEEYNQAVGGASRSQHKQNRALDLVPHGATPADLFKVFEGLREAGAFKGGRGLYSSFVHVDTRGENATWGA